MISNITNIIQIFLGGMITTTFIGILLEGKKKQKKNYYFLKMFAIVNIMVLAEVLEHSNLGHFSIFIEEIIPWLYAFSSISLIFIIYFNSKKSNLL